MSIEQLLDARDSDHFATRWMCAYNAIDSQKDRIDSIQSDISTLIRKTTYLRTFARWKSPALAAYISDDFGLIADAAALGTHDNWIDALLLQYKSGVIPFAP